MSTIDLLNINRVESENYVTRKLIFVQSLSIHCEPSMGVNWEIIGCNVCVIDWSKVVICYTTNAITN